MVTMTTVLVTVTKTVVTMTTAAITMMTLVTMTTIGSNGIDIKVSRHHTVSVSNFQSIEVSTDDWMVPFLRYSWIPWIIHPLNFLQSNVNYYFLNIISSFSLYKLDLQRKYRVSSIEHNSGIVKFRIIFQFIDYRRALELFFRFRMSSHARALTRVVMRVRHHEHLQFAFLPPGGRVGDGEALRPLPAGSVIKRKQLVDGRHLET